MQFLSDGFIEANIPYLTLVIGVLGCLVLYLGLGHEIQRLRGALRMQRQRVEKLERRLSKVLGDGEEETAAEGPAPQAARQKVLQLHGLGRSSEEIARQAGMREAEVDFLLRVQEHMETPGRALALRKIS